jgi:hypothetical protein
LWIGQIPLDEPGIATDFLLTFGRVKENRSWDAATKMLSTLFDITVPREV